MILVFIFLGLIVIQAILFLILILSTIKLKVENLRIGSYKNNKKYKAFIQIYFLDKIKIFSIKINNEKLKKVYESNRFKNVDFNKLKEVLPSNRETLRILKKLTPKIEKLNLEANLGMEDASLTSYTVGVIASLVGIILPHIVKEMNHKKIRYVVNPIYNKNLFNIYLDSIISLKIVHVINVIYLLAKKGREKFEKQLPFGVVAIH